jgi:hypothetical protein
VSDDSSLCVTLSGPLLGVPKSLSAYLSGEMKDTAELGPAEKYVFGDEDSRGPLAAKNRQALMKVGWGEACVDVMCCDEVPWKCGVRDDAFVTCAL